VSVRDREAPGSNPGPPTKIQIRFRRRGSWRQGAGSQPDHNFPDRYEIGIFRLLRRLPMITCRGVHEVEALTTPTPSYTAKVNCRRGRRV